MVLVVTRHPALFQYLVEEGIIPSDARLLEHATADDVRGKHVIGVLPLQFAAEAASITTIPLNITPELRGVELSVEQVRRIAGAPQLFIEYNEELADRMRKVLIADGYLDYPFIQTAEVGKRWGMQRKASG